MSRLLIPKVFHRVWLGKNSMPEQLERFGRTWQTFHPGWEMKLWTDANVPPLRNQRLYDSLDILSEKSDILRYELVYQFGGVYLDTDFECARNIEPLLVDAKAFTAQEDPGLVGAAIFGAVPGHPAFGAIIRGFPRWYRAHRRSASPIRTGNYYFSRVAQRRSDIRIFERELFYPWGWEGRGR